MSSRQAKLRVKTLKRKKGVTFRARTRYASFRTIELSHRNGTTNAPILEGEFQPSTHEFLNIDPPLPDKGLISPPIIINHHCLTIYVVSFSKNLGVLPQRRPSNRWERFGLALGDPRSASSSNSTLVFDTITPPLNLDLKVANSLPGSSG